jgi:hypothetical protein
MTTDAPDARQSPQSPDGAPADDDRYRHLTVGDQVLLYDRLVAGAWIQAGRTVDHGSHR